MAAGQVPAIVCDQPMEQWTSFSTGWDSQITRVDAINMPHLHYFGCDSNPIRTLPWHDLQELTVLGVSGCSLEKLDLWRLPRLQYCYGPFNELLVEVDAHGLASLEMLDVSISPSLSSVNIQGCSSLNSIDVSECALPQAEVDQILADLVAGNLTDGRALLHIGTNEPPSNPDGIALKNILLSRGWTVYTN